MLWIGILIIQLQVSSGISQSTVLSSTPTIAQTSSSATILVNSSDGSTANISASAVNDQPSASIAASNVSAGNGTPSQSDNVSRTVTLELASSMFNTTATAGQQTTATVTPTGSTTNRFSGLLDKINDILKRLNKTQTEDPVAPGECDNLNWSPTVQNCHTKACIELNMASIEKLTKCQGNKPSNVSKFAVADLVEAYGKQLAQLRTNVTDTGMIFKKQFLDTANDNPTVFGSGEEHASFINTTTAKFLSYPNYSNPNHFTGRWQNTRDEIKIPIGVLRGKVSTSVLYTWSVFPDLYQSKLLTPNDIEMDHMALIAASKESELFVDDSGNLMTTKKFEETIVNTNVFSMTFFPPLGVLSEVVLVTLRHKKVEGYEKPQCVYWNKEKRILSPHGCKVHETNTTHTICACNHFTSFAVVMKAKIEDDSINRALVVTVAWVFGSISLLCLLLCGICIITVGYYYVDNMRIALNINVALILSHLTFFIGLSTSHANFYSSQSVCEVISPFVHLFELAALTWLLMEGLHYLHCMLEISKLKEVVFNSENTKPYFIYAAVGWGVPIAFAAACAGYSYPHFGTPRKAEFCWLSVQGAEAWYFAGPVLILVLLNMLVRGFVLKEVLQWKGNPDDISIERTWFRLVTSVVLLPIIILTWLFGILAANHSEDKVFHYLFIIFYTLQGILVFLFYCVKNAELWEYQREKKEETMKVKNAVFHFDYVP